MRYNKNAIKKTLDGKDAYQATILPNIPINAMDITIATETGDRLDTLANEFYGDPGKWWVIASANNILNASFGLVDGTVLRIPKDISQILTQL
jgi:nucleoid-associated protein YgaU